MAISVGDITLKSYKRTYASTFINFTAATTPTTVLVIPGVIASVTVVKVTRIGISATQTTASIVNMQLHKLSSALTGGTTGIPIPAQYDSRSASSFSAIRKYTANPTGGGIVLGLVRNVKFTIPGSSVVGAKQNEYIFDFVTNYSEGLTLRGTSEILALSFLGATITGLALSMWVEWTEE